MVSINFFELFGPDIASGKKTQTIRNKTRCKIGGAVQLFTGQRTKNCVRLGEGVCTSVEPIEIHEAMIKLNGEVLGINEMIELVEADGFNAFSQSSKNLAEFFEFFETKYEIPFHGFLIKWELPQCPNHLTTTTNKTDG